MTSAQLIELKKNAPRDAELLNDLIQAGASPEQALSLAQKLAVSMPGKQKAIGNTTQHKHRADLLEKNMPQANLLDENLSFPAEIAKNAILQGSTPKQALTLAQAHGANLEDIKAIQKFVQHRNQTAQDPTQHQSNTTVQTQLLQTQSKFNIKQI